MDTLVAPVIVADKLAWGLVFKFQFSINVLAAPFATSSKFVPLALPLKPLSVVLLANISLMGVAAANKFKRGVVMLFLGSVICTPVVVKRACIWASDSSG